MGKHLYELNKTVDFTGKMRRFSVCLEKTDCQSSPGYLIFHEELNPGLVVRSMDCFELPGMSMGWLTKPKLALPKQYMVITKHHSQCY